MALVWTWISLVLLLHLHINPSSAFCGNPNYLNSTFTLAYSDSVDFVSSNLSSCTVLYGSLTVLYSFNATALSVSTLPFLRVEGDLSLIDSSLSSTDLFASLQSIRGALVVQGNTDLAAVSFRSLQFIGYNFILSGNPVVSSLFMPNLTSIGGFAVQDMPQLTDLTMCALANVTRAKQVNVTEAPLLPCDAPRNLFSLIHAMDGSMGVMVSMVGGCEESFDVCPAFCEFVCNGSSHWEFGVFLLLFYPILIIVSLYQLMRIAYYSCRAGVCKCNIMIWQHFLVILNCVLRMMLCASIFVALFDRTPAQIKSNRFFVTLAVSLSFSVSIITFSYLILTWASLHHFAMSDKNPFEKMKRFFVIISLTSFVISVVSWAVMVYYYATQIANDTFVVMSYLMGSISALFSLTILFYGISLVRTLSKSKGVVAGQRRRVKPSRLPTNSSSSDSSTTSQSEGHENQNDDTQSPPKGRCRYFCFFMFCWWNVTATERLLYGALMFGGVFTLMSFLLVITAPLTNYNKYFAYTSYSILIELLFWLSFVIILWLFSAGVNALNPALRRAEDEHQKQLMAQQAEQEREQIKRDRELDRAKHKAGKPPGGDDTGTGSVRDTRSESQLSTASSTPASTGGNPVRVSSAKGIGSRTATNSVVSRTHTAELDDVPIVR